MLLCSCGLMSKLPHERATPLALAAHLIEPRLHDHLIHTHAGAIMAVAMAVNVVISDEVRAQCRRDERLVGVASRPAGVRVRICIAPAPSASWATAVACADGPNACADRHVAMNCTCVQGVHSQATGSAITKRPVARKVRLASWRSGDRELALTALAWGEVGPTAYARNRAEVVVGAGVGPAQTDTARATDGLHARRLPLWLPCTLHVWFCRLIVAASLEGRWRRRGRLGWREWRGR